MSSQQFCLKWNNHTTNMLSIFESLLSTEALVDVTLACDGLSLKAHKMVLSACSPFFQSLFLENPCKHPIVIMKDMRYCDLKAIIDFMYRGEVNVSHDQLSALLKTAETLKVKGLSEVTGQGHGAASGIVQQEITQQSVPTPTATPIITQRTDTPPLHGKRKRGRPRKRSLSDSNRSDDEGVATKIKEPASPEIEELSGEASIETSDIRSGGGPTNSQSQVPTQTHSSSHLNSFSKSHLSQEPQVEEPISGDEFEVEPSKLLEQTLTTDNVPSTNSNSSGHIALPSVSGLEISKRSMSSTDNPSVPPSDNSNMQGPDSPQDIKPQIITFEDSPISPVAGPSHSSDRSVMMYMDQSTIASIPGPSNYQDNSSLVSQDSQPQVRRTLWWNQRVRLQKLQAATARNKLKSLGYVINKYNPKQAICPFCYKVFYDKSTMNRHVSKKVCLGLHFTNPDFQSNVPSMLNTITSIKQPDLAKIEDNAEDLNATVQYSEATIKKSYDSPSKSNRIPCPYCNKMLKGERGVRKHIDFYGCPMATIKSISSTSSLTESEHKPDS